MKRASFALEIALYLKDWNKMWTQYLKNMQKSLQVVQAIVMLCIVPFDPKDISEKRERSFAWEKICGKVLRGKVLVGGKSGKNEW